MRRAIPPIIATLVVSAILGATVFREQVAWAAQLVDANITNVDGKGNIKVHEQGIAAVRQVPPNRPFATRNTQAHDRVELLLPEPKGTGYAVTSITLTNTTDETRSIDLAVFGSPSRDCLEGSPSFTIDFGPHLVALPHSTLHLPYPEPWVLPGEYRSTGSVEESWVCLVSIAEPDSVSPGLFLNVVGYRF